MNLYTVLDVLFTVYTIVDTSLQLERGSYTLYGHIPLRSRYRSAPPCAGCAPSKFRTLCDNCTKANAVQGTEEKRLLKEKRQALVEVRDPQYFAGLHPRMETPDLKKLVAKVWNSNKLANTASYCVEDDSVFLMLWYRYRQVPGRQNRLPLADSGGAHVFKEPRCAKDGPQSCQYGCSCVEWLCAGR